MKEEELEQVKKEKEEGKGDNKRKADEEKSAAAAKLRPAPGPAEEIKFIDVAMESDKVSLVSRAATHENGLEKFNFGVPVIVTEPMDMSQTFPGRVL